MAVISRVTTWSDGQTLTASALNGEISNILNDYNGNITDANISASANISISKIATGVSGSLVGTTDTQTLTNKTLTNPTINTPTVTSPTESSPTFTGGVSLSNNGTVTQTGTADHITLMPGASKLVRFTVLEQARDLTNTYRNNTVILSGYCNKQGVAASGMAQSISFGITFATNPIIIVGSAGQIGNSISQYGDTVTALCVSALSGGFSGFNLGFATGSGSNFDTSRFYYAHWIAIGTI